MNIYRIRRGIGTTIYHAFMLLFCFVLSYPLIWVFSSSLKETKDVMRTAEQLFVSNPYWENYVNGWRGFGDYTYTTFYKNTFILCLNNVAGVVVTSAISAFGFARIRFTGRKFWFALMIGTMMLPGSILQIPTYIMYKNIGWVGTWNPMMIPCWFGGGAFNIFLLMQFMRNIPKEMDESARIDGCGWFGIFSRIVWPLIVPALFTVGVMTFIGHWGDYYSALIYLNKPEFYPIGYALKLYADEQNINYGPMLAMSFVSIVPLLIMFFLFQRTLVEGINMDGVKG